jgi:hypothetical protein
MKINQLLIFLILPFNVFAQSSENFSDGNFTSNPEWIGDTACFKVDSLFELQSHGPAASSVLGLSTSSTKSENTEWQFYIRLEFSPSTTNYAKFYLMSDQADCKGSLNGYFVKIGGISGTSDAIDLYRQEGNSSTKIISGIPGNAGKNINSLRIKIIRDELGKWDLYSDTTGRNNFSMEGSCIDSLIKSSLFSGLVCYHTSTRNDKFFFDDIEIKDAPLSILKIKPFKMKVDIYFSKDIDSLSACNPSNYIISNGIGCPSLATLDPVDRSLVNLTLTKELFTANYTISITDVKDAHGVLLQPNSTLDFTYIKPLTYGSIMITEIYADPSPSVELPGGEYIEIYNTTNDTLNLKNYIFHDSTSKSVLPVFNFAPKSFLILCSNSFENAYTSYGNVLGLSSWPSLNNTGDRLTLQDLTGNIIFTVAYTDTWYGDAIKKEGGWSLELIDPNNLCGEENNWSASEAPEGGTPGKLNSINAGKPDISPPVLLKAEIQDSLTIKLFFNEALDTLHCLKENFIINPSNKVADLKITAADTRSIYAKLAFPLVGKILYHINILNIPDCNGNIAANNTVSFALPETADVGEVIINEVLFNPRSNGVDFVEIYNNSDKYIDLQGWELANFVNNEISNKKSLTSEPFLFKPHDYLFFSIDPAIIKNQYPNTRTSSAITLNALPSFNDDEGSVILLNNNVKTDRFDYSEKFHFPLIDDKEGVSLERISFTSPSNAPDNWHSASTTEGYATPGYRNSQAYTTEPGNGFVVDPKVFTPDEDGNKDFTAIHYNFPSPGNMLTITVYDIAGREVKRLVQNQLIGSEGFFQWDGLNGSGEKVRVGYFIIFIEVFNLHGEVKKFRESVVVANRP